MQFRGRIETSLDLIYKLSALQRFDQIKIKLL